MKVIWEEKDFEHTDSYTPMGRVFGRFTSADMYIMSYRFGEKEQFTLVCLNDGMQMGPMTMRKMVDHLNKGRYIPFELLLPRKQVQGYFEGIKKPWKT